MAPEVHFFLQWDFILFVIITALWGARVFETIDPRFKGENSIGRPAIVFVLIVLGYLINPGTVLSALLFLREDFLRADDNDKEKSK